MGGSVKSVSQPSNSGVGTGTGLLGSATPSNYGNPFGLGAIGRLMQNRNVPNAPLPAPPAGNTPVGQAPQRAQGVYQPQGRPMGQPMGQPTNMPQYIPGSAMQGQMNPFAAALYGAQQQIQQTPFNQGMPMQGGGMLGGMGGAQMPPGMQQQQGVPPQVQQTISRLQAGLPGIMAFYNGGITQDNE